MNQININIITVANVPLNLKYYKKAKKQQKV